MSEATEKLGYERTFSRFELKYLMHYTQAREVMNIVGTHVRSDRHRGREGFYKISSLYYDSPDLKCYREKLDGEKYRRKVRVRTYGDRPEDAFVEIKQRYNMSVQKRRCRAPLETVQKTMARICAGRYAVGADPVYDETFILAQRYLLEPKIVVSYQRAAFFDRYKRDLRITLDRNIRFRHLSLDLSQDRMSGRFAIPPTTYLMEVKFNEAIPRWLCTCLNRLDLKAQRLSKYCQAIEVSGLDRWCV